MVSRLKRQEAKYPTETMSNANYTDDLELFASALVRTESQLNKLEQAAGGIGFYANAYKTELIWF